MIYKIIVMTTLDSGVLWTCERVIITQIHPPLATVVGILKC
ncbi:hypothetical protein SAMN05216167_11520 [Spirosoma endophyticum]|uniref:Uncharacterized protein n=1 Tax=Spirosoma endophyticum TaxID=662367 RepID=A0A1I2B8S2_9BACT|nr:hypothetical protein SAMN05216167_11520 [Spirosoma endophyticum]